MYETIKSYITRNSWEWYLIVAGIACAICWIIYGGSSDNSSTVEHLERAQDEQHKSVELNQSVSNSIERSAHLNRQASERIVRAQEYQQQAVARIDESASRLDEAESLLERNEQLIERVEQGHQAQSSNGTTVTPTTQYVGVD